MTTPKPLRVIVADDSITVRKSLIRALAQASDIEVIAEAADGRQLVDLCTRLRPDVITMDVVMPGMDGVHATEEIMARVPTPILVVSAAENRGENFTTLSALAAGAVEVLEKPRESGKLASFEEALRRTVRLVARIPVITRPRGWLQPRAFAAPAPAWSGSARLVAIGASTGGPAVLAQILTGLPRDYPLPILLVMHIGPAFGFALSEWLDGMSKLKVQQVQDGERLAVGRVHVCPPDRHLILRDERLFLTSDPERHSCRPSVDVLFESVAGQCGRQAVGCLLTGIGRDGAQGLLAMQRAGALTIAQDEASSAVFGMPREAIALGAADLVGNPQQITGHLLGLINRQNASWS
ncbi:MAG: chemotaxis-specific protein-glutamate methyltransferase CheB [Myxococcales bacterium]